MSKLQDLLKKNRYELNDLQKKSKAWFAEQARSLRPLVVNPRGLLRANKGDIITTKILPGRMYLFQYDPKFKDTLPYYDQFPLVFPIERYPDGFLGLNIHYLPPQLRIRLLDRLLEFRNNTRMDETTKLRVSWSIITSVSKMAIAEPCVKRYLYPHVKTPFKQIIASDWASAAMLPIEQFQYASATQVWQESIKRAGGVR